MCFFKKRASKSGKQTAKTVRISGQQGFIAAYSDFPFAESSPPPGYSFYCENGVYWCVKAGRIEVPWGFSARDCGFSANGFLVLERARVSALTLEKTGFRFTEEDGAFYLYETVADDNGKQGK